MGEVPKFVDGLNQEVNAGDLVAFRTVILRENPSLTGNSFEVATRVGSVAEMRVALVDRVEYREKFRGGYHNVYVRSWSARERRWKAAREVNHTNLLKLSISRDEFESLPSNGFV